MSSVKLYLNCSWFSKSASCAQFTVCGPPSFVKSKCTPDAKISLHAKPKEGDGRRRRSDERVSKDLGCPEEGCDRILDVLAIRWTERRRRRDDERRQTTAGAR